MKIRNVRGGKSMEINALSFIYFLQQSFEGLLPCRNRPDNVNTVNTTKTPVLRHKCANDNSNKFHGQGKAYPSHP